MTVGNNSQGTESAPNRANNGGNGNKFTPVLVAVIGAFLGSSGTIAVYLGTPVGQQTVRPDPFTGSQATALIQTIDTVKEDIDDHIKFHPDRENQFDRRIATLEAQYAIILQNQARILDRLDTVR